MTKIRVSVEAKKYSKNPILTPVLKEKSFETACVFNPAAIVKDKKVFLLYRAEDLYYNNYISRIGLAWSEDGFRFKRYKNNPVINKGKKLTKTEKRGSEDPRIIRINNMFFLTYTAIPKDGPVSLCGAFSKDLIHWKKTGTLISKKMSGPDTNAKAGAIVQDYKYKGKYVMYFGEGVIKMALSRNLKNWEIIEKPVLKPRKWYFDDSLVEGGPPPIVTEKGILMIYNSRKTRITYEGIRKWLSYSPGFAIFDKNNPTKLLFRSEKPILKPTEYWEKYGKVNNVIFATGLVYFKKKWLLYYGGADKSIGVAEIKIQ
ncbi:MAG: glycosidase [Candidatus Aenigmatarchaeota archaeon]|nr:MAG: glycosidase [Candidatus Aenigmarchaeota archaeon]